MEPEDKNKKKRNRKKKNNSHKPNTALDEVSEDQNQSSIEVKDVVNHVKESEVSNYDTDSTNLVESDKQQWLLKEAGLEETIRQLQIEKETYIQKEANLVDTVDQLQNENNLRLQKEANLEIKIGQLQREKDSWVSKESQLVDRISQLVDEKITWDLKELNLEERVKHVEAEKHSWIIKEDSNRATIANLSDDITRLRVQVVELEESRNILLHENQQLMGNVSSLQLQIEDIQSIASSRSSDELTKLVSERDGLTSQLESAFVLIERLMEENAELVDKVSKLLIRVDQYGGVSDARRSTISPDPIIGTSSETSSSATPRLMGHESNAIDIIVPAKEERNGVYDDSSNYHFDDQLHESSTSEESGEIVQISLDGNGISSDLELQDMESDEKDATTPFSDAPLIGAPFRLISVVSRYVTGADLVNKNSLQV